MPKYRITSIKFDTDGDEALAKTLAEKYTGWEFEAESADDAETRAADLVSDTSNWLVESLEFEPVPEKQLTLELDLIVTYDPNDTPVEELKSRLESLVTTGMGDGLLTGDSAAEVDTHSYRIFARGKSHWDDDKEYPVEDWQAQVANNETRLGYHAWVAHEKEDF